MKEKYPVLIGHSARACKKLFTMEQVADFICEQGLYGEVTIETPEGLMLKGKRMNEYERLRRQAIVLRDMYPPGTRVVI